MTLNLRTKYQSLPLVEKLSFLSSLSQQEYRQVRFFSDTLLRDNQIITPGDWRYWLFVGGRGAGKLLDLNTDLPTPNGFIKLHQLKQGDTLFDENGEPCKVLQLHPINLAPESYQLTFDDGSITVNACADHLWLTWDKAARKSHHRVAKHPQVRTTKQLKDTLHNQHSILCPSMIDSSNYHRYIVDIQPIPPVPMRCITVDSPSHLFLITKSFIPTHNSLTGATELRKRIYAKHTGLSILAPTHQDLIKVMIPAIQKEFPSDQQPTYIGGDKKILYCHNGITVDCKTSQQGEQRGANASFIWIDELVKCWDGNPDKIETNFAILDASVRKGNSQILITTTGNHWSIFRRFYDMYQANNPLIQIRTGKMSDNEYLSPQAQQALYQQYGNSRYEDLELNGIINFDVDGALWSPALINKTRKTSMEEVANPPNPNKIRKYQNPMDFFIKFAIGADPATTSHANSDAWGVCVVGLGRDHHLYVLEDHSKVMSPNDAANIIVNLHHKYRNAQVIAESNQGGEMITYILRTKNPHLQPKLIHAHQNKMVRAQPIVVLWDQDRAHIVGQLQQLEKEMCEYTGDPSQKSPNRLDALVYACQHLLLEPNISSSNSTWLPNYR